MAKGKKKRNRQSSNEPVPDARNNGDSSDSGELKSQPSNSESTPCNKLHWSSSCFACYISLINIMFCSSSQTTLFSCQKSCQHQCCT